MTVSLNKNLFFFPSVSHCDVNNYIHLAENYADKLASVLSSKTSRSYSQIKKATMLGFESKIAAVLIHGLNPEETIDFNYKENNYQNFINGSDIMTAWLEETNEEENYIVISLNRNKYESILTRAQMNSSNYAENIEFVYYDKETERYYHLGKVSTLRLPSPCSSNSRRVNLQFQCPFNQEGSYFNLTT